jgi:glutamine cyclotransferase
MNMKRVLFTLVITTLILTIGPFGGTVSAQDGPPPLQDQIETAVVSGLAWLANQQNEDGSWGYYPGGCDRVAYTGLAVLKFETRAIELGLDPMGEEYVYAAQVVDGLAYIVANAHDLSISIQPAGDPDTNGNGEGIYFNQSECGPSHDIYNTGIAMMAIAASGHPELYADLLQDAVDYTAWAQADETCGVHRGGWRYWPDCWSDNSNTGYVTLGLGFAEAPPPFGFGLTVPQFVKDELSIWVDIIQDDVDGDPDDGGSWYEPYWSWVNILKTGNLIFEMVLVGDTVGAPRLQDALDYIERHWQDQNIDPGWGYNVYPANYQALFILKKGLDFARIPLIDLDGDGTPEHDWFSEIATVVLNQQNEDGSWPWCDWGDPILCTTWALLSLEPFVPPSPGPIDIKPGSCPNPLSTTDKGVFPVAILGLEDFDVTQIDPATVRLFRKGIADPIEVTPLRWSLEDAGIPYEPFTGRMGAYDCLEYYPDEYGVFDGYLDLSFKFDAQEVVAALGEVNDGDVLVLQLSGKIKEEYGGTGFVGEDVVVIIDKIAPSNCGELTVVQSLATPEGSQPHGLAFDGDNLWSVGRDVGKIYELNLDGDILSSFAAPGAGATGLTFDGTYLWHATDSPPRIYKLDTTGNVILSFAAPGTDSTGLTFEDEYLWNADFNWGIPGGYLHRIDVSNPEAITFTTFDSPGEGPEGLAFDGKYLWNVDYHENSIYKLDTSANVLCAYQSFGIHPIGLTFDGKYLWLADEATRTIYKIDIGNK